MSMINPCCAEARAQGVDCPYLGVLVCPVCDADFSDRLRVRIREHNYCSDAHRQKAYRTRVELHAEIAA